MTADPPSNDGHSSDADPAGEYIVVARRYRPQTFEELVGQNQVSQALGNAIATNRVGHAYLFTGARGVGKTSTARILAKCLNCVDGPTSTPCGQCDQCESIAAGDDVDVLEIDGASNRGIDEIRQLRSNVNVRPSRSRFKIYIIDEVHMLTVPAFNALLKTLEEPPEHVKFIFCTTDPERIPITVLSRCQRFDFAPVGADSIVDRLRFIVDSEGIEAEDAALGLLARRAAGSMRDSQSLLEQLLSFCGERISENDVHAMLGTAQVGRLSSITERLVARDASGALAELDSAVRDGVDVGQLTEQLVGYFRDMMAAVVGCPADLMLHTASADQEGLKEAGTKLGLETILAIVQILDQAVARMRQSPHVRTLVEIALVRICSLDDLDELPQLIAQLRQGGVASPNSAATPATAAQAASAPRKPAQKKTEVGGQVPRQADDNNLPGKRRPPASHSGEVGRPAPSAVGGQVPNQQEPAKPVSSPAEPAVAPVEWTAQSAERLWGQALSEIGGVTADMGGNFESIAISAPNLLVVHLKGAYNKDWCERQDVKRKIEQTMSRLTGRAIQVSFTASREDAPKRTDRRQAAQARWQKMREVEEHPLVKEVVKLFGAEVTGVDQKRNS